VKDLVVIQVLFFYKLHMDLFFCIISCYGMLYDVINLVILLLSWLVVVMPFFCFFFFLFSLANLGFPVLLILRRNDDIFWYL